MGIDLATWRARIGLNYYHICRPHQTKWRSSGGQLCQPGVASWGVGEVMNNTTIVLKGCMTVVALSLILLYVVHSWTKLNGRGGGGKLHCHWKGSTFRERGTVDGGGTGLVTTFVVVIPLLLVIAGDVEVNPGPPVLTLKAAMNAMYSVCDKWYTIGVQLEVPTFELRNIAKKPGHSMDQLCDTLDYWMNKVSSPTWKQLVDALKAPSVGENRLAEEIEKKYCDPEEQTNCNESKAVLCHQEVSLTSQDPTTPERTGGLTSEDPSSSAAKPSNNINPPLSEDSEVIRKIDIVTEPDCNRISPPPSERSQKPPFGCGCGKCTFFNFLQNGCPTPIPSTSSFPYLNLSGLTQQQQQELEGRLRFESREIMMRFQELVSATIKSLITRNVPQDEIVSHVMTLGAFDPVFKEPQVPLFQYCFKELKTADTIPKIFLVLKDYFSFFNYDIIGHIITVLGTEKDKANLQSYKETFDRYAKRRIYECGPHFGPVSDTDHADVFVKVDSRYDSYTVEEIKGFCNKLSETLHVSSQGVLRLCRVEKGCFQLTFQLPFFVKQDIFPLSREKERTLEAMDVIELTCLEYHFLKGELSQPEVEKHQGDRDDDSQDDSGKGPSTFTVTKSTTFSEDCLDKELKELDYELRVQGLVETASSQKSKRSFELQFAVAMGQLEYVRFLVEKKRCNPLQRDQDGISPLHVAAIEGHLRVFKYFVTECNCHPECPGPLGLTPLHLAIEQGHLDIVKYLVIEQQIDPLCEDEYQNTPLHRACADGCQAVVEFLTSEITKYIPITEVMSKLKNKWNSTPLHIATLKKQLGIIQFFISDQNCDPNVPGEYDRTLLHYAAELGHLNIVKYLTDEQGCNPSCLDGNKCTPLHCAAMKGHMDVVKFLTMEKNCDPMCRDLDMKSPFCMAAQNGHIGVVKFLTLEMHCDPSSRDTNSETALHLAVMNGHLDIVQFFISDQNCDPNLPGQGGVTALHIAAKFGHLHIIMFLIDEQDCNPSCLSEHKDTPLHWATMAGNMDIVKFFTVEKHCDPMCKDSDQKTPLHMAALNGHIDIVKFLILEMHCDPASRNADNDTALHLAIANGHLDIVKFLITDQNCDPNFPGEHDATALHYAAEFGHLHIMKYLTDEQGCNPLCLDGNKNTPLHCAAMKGHIDIVKFLTKEKQCDPMSQNKFGFTVFLCAATSGHLETIEFFVEELKCPADTQGPIPLQMALYMNHHDIAEYLQKHSVIPYIYTAMTMVKQLSLQK